MTAIEHKELKGITVRLLFVTITGVVSIVISVMTTYFGLKSDISDLKNKQETQDKLFEVRLKMVELQIAELKREQEK